MSLALALASASFLFVLSPIQTAQATQGFELFTWGSNSYGQLGVGDQTNRNVPTQVGDEDDWVSLAGGAFHSLAINSNGELFAWGRNHHGQLGVGDAVPLDGVADSPIQVGTDDNWVKVEARGNVSAALNSDGELFAWGFNTGGQLGIGNTIASIAVPTPAVFPANVGNRFWVTLAVGDFNIFVIDDTGALFSVGGG